MVPRLSSACERLVRHLNEQHFSGLVISGGSHRLTRCLVTLTWRRCYGDTPLPKIFILPRKVNHLMYKSNGREMYRDWVREWIHTFLPELIAMQKEHLCCVDDYAMSGLKCAELSKLFQDLGFSHMDFAVFAASKKTELPNHVFASTYDDDLVCLLCELSLLIQGEPSLQELLQKRPEAPAQRRARALEKIREVGRAVAA